MKTLSALLFYLTASIALVCGFAAGARWLVAPAPLEARPIRAAPIPPRIAESIERKMAREPERERAPVKPAMQEASVSLSVQPVPQFRIRELIRVPQQTQQRKKSRRDQRKETRPNGSEFIEARAAQPAVTSARTDFPY